MLEVEELRSAYGRIEAVKGVSLSVRTGEIVALVGARIETAPPHRRVALGMAHVPEGRQVFAPLTVADNLRLGAFLRRDQDIARDIERIYAMFPALADKRRDPAGGLSGGQQQMLAIGRALMA